MCIRDRAHAPASPARDNVAWPVLNTSAGTGGGFIGGKSGNRRGAIRSPSPVAAALRTAFSCQESYCMCPSKVADGDERGWIIPIGGAENKEDNPRILTRFLDPVSYTHLDVYKRQIVSRI